jgi:FKBP-type peptidyl-prolyl cis-trans isomerase SlpA
MNEPVEVQASSIVTIHYRIILEDGSEVESTYEEEPLTFTMGDGTLHKGMEFALYGKKKGEKESILIGPEIAFGYHDETAVVEMPKSDFPSDLKAEVGAVIHFTTPAGDEVPGIIKEDLGDKLKVDLNHPLAGHEFTFEFDVLDVDNSRVEL